MDGGSRGGFDSLPLTSACLYIWCVCVRECERVNWHCVSEYAVKSQIALGPVRDATIKLLGVGDCRD